MSTRYWLMKSEPEAFSIEDLRDRSGGVEAWDGVRNYQARNFMRDEMKQGDRAIFYHSGRHPAAVGTMRVVREGYPDETALDTESDHYDPRSSPENPIWFMVDVKFESIFRRPVPLAEIRGIETLSGMQLLKKGNRLSIMPVTRKEFDTILRLGNRDA
ncbi:MAG: EVE domain-containing protein [Desulfobacterales bacterium]